MRRRPTLSLNEWAVLGLLAERPRHGYDIAGELAPDAELGQVWRLDRPLVYRAVERLAALGLAAAQGTEPGSGGPPRTVHAATAVGRERLDDWLRTPVEHVRDLRSGFLLKLVVAQRLGVAAGPLVRAQRERLDRQLSALGAPPPPDQVVALWRHHAARAAGEFLLAVEAGTTGGPGAASAVGDVGQ